MFADGVIFSPSFDWIDNTLYGVSFAGIVFGCEAKTKGPVNCHPVLKEGNVPFDGIAMDPNDCRKGYARHEYCWKLLEQHAV